MITTIMVVISETATPTTNTPTPTTSPSTTSEGMSPFKIFVTVAVSIILFCVVAFAVWVIKTYLSVNRNTDTGIIVSDEPASIEQVELVEQMPRANDIHDVGLANNIDGAANHIEAVDEIAAVDENANHGPHNQNADDGPHINGHVTPPGANGHRTPPNVVDGRNQHDDEDDISIVDGRDHHPGHNSPA